MGKKKRKPAVVIELPLYYDEDTTAIIFDRETGLWYDDAWNLESALNYVHDPSVVVIGVGPDSWRPDITTAQVEEAIEHEYRLVNDCFGWPIPEVVAA